MKIPNCSPCGLAVEWARECYSSAWNLFRDNPGHATPGEYYFAPFGTPFYNGVHNLWSQRWLDRNNGLQQGLGEVFTRFPVHLEGFAPAALPGNFQTGNTDCIADGELFENAITSENMENGVPRGCWVQLPLALRSWGEIASFDSCGTQFFYATMLVWIREGKLAEVTEACRMFFGVNSTITHHPGAALFPEITTIVTESYSVALITGTSNVQQIATYAFEAITGPTNAGIFSTVPLWYHQASNAIRYLENDGMTAAHKVLFVGHSYGAASAAIAAARLRYKSASRDIRRLTFGSPKPGDERLRHYNLFVPGIDIANDDDLITALPPDRLTIAAVSHTLGLLSLFVWDEWYPQAAATQMNPDGVLRINGLPLMDYETLLNWTIRAINHVALPTIDAHFMTEYRQRILRRCPVREWPLSVELWNYLNHIIPVPDDGIAEAGAEAPQIVALAEAGDSV